MKKKLALLAAAAVAAGILLGGCGGSKGSDTKSSSAAWKPEKDVKIIVAYKAGSGTDTGARLLANSAKKYVGQTLVIENKPGADGKIGWTELAKAKPEDTHWDSSICRPTPRSLPRRALPLMKSPLSRLQTT